MITTVSMAAERRTANGKGAARQLRLAGRIPAVIYGRGRDAEALSLAASDLDKFLAAHATSSTVIELAFNGKAVKTLIREVQRHPAKRGVTHVDFYEIHEGETLTMDVPIRLVGQPAGVRAGGTLDQSLRELEIEVLPKDIPEHVELDVSELEIGDSLHVSDLSVSNVKVLTDLQGTICTVIPPRVEETEEVAEGIEEEDVSAEPELIRKPKGEGEDEGDEE